MTPDEKAIALANLKEQKRQSDALEASKQAVERQTEAVAQRAERKATAAAQQTAREVAARVLPAEVKTQLDGAIADGLPPVTRPIAEKTARTTAAELTKELVPREVAGQLPSVVGDRLPGLLEPALVETRQAAEREARRTSIEYAVAHPAKAGPPGVGTKGDKGEKGLNWRGPYDGRRRYLPDDAVSHDGSSWIATSVMKGVQPPATGWDTLAQRGADGRSLGGGSGQFAVYEDGVLIGRARDVDFIYDDPPAHVTIDHGIARIPAGTGSGGGSGSGTPSDTVAAETTFDIAPDAGTADEYSRGDHTHGTPEQPEGTVAPITHGDGEPTALRYASIRLGADSGGSSGDFKLRFRADTTTAIAWDATFADIIAALEALSSVGSGNVRAEPGTTLSFDLNEQQLVIQFIGALAGAIDLDADFEIVDDTTDLDLFLPGTPFPGSDADPVDPAEGDRYIDDLTGFVYLYDATTSDDYPAGHWASLVLEVVAQRQPLNGQGGSLHFQVPDSDDGVTGGTFTVIVNGEETAPITWDVDYAVTQANMLAAINALPGIDGQAFLD